VIHLVMLLHSVISAGTYLAAKRALAELSPFELALGRFLLAGAVFAAVVAHRRVRVSRKDLLALGALGFVAVPLNQGLFLAGLARSTPGHAALLYALTPIFVFLFARLRLGERATWAKVLGIVLAFAGTLVVLLGRGVLGGGGEEAGRAFVGDLLLLGAVIAWAVYAVGGKIYAERYGALPATAVAVTIGTLLYLPLGVALTDFDHFRALSRTGWASLAYLVALTSVVAYILYSWALSREDASKVAIWSNLQPVLTAFLAWGIYGERLTAPFVAGGAMVLAGVVLTQR
jgi:drug/metabolite transporter (DMT)-like permease